MPKLDLVLGHQDLIDLGHGVKFMIPTAEGQGVTVRYEDDRAKPPVKGKAATNGHVGPSKNVSPKKKTRRHHSLAFKRKIARLGMAEGAVWEQIARRYKISPSLVGAWSKGQRMRVPGGQSKKKG